MFFKLDGSVHEAVEAATAGLGQFVFVYCTLQPDVSLWSLLG